MTPVTAAEKAGPSITAFGTARSTISGTPLTAEDLRKTQAYWRACNYLMLGMIWGLTIAAINQRQRAAWAARSVVALA